MNFDEVIKCRRSVRNFSNKKVSWKDVLEAIDAANQGPFSGNHNNLKFLIIENEKTIKEISEICEQEWIVNSSLVVLIASDDLHLERIYGERGRVYSRQQAGAVINTFILKLQDLGVDSCWVGAFSDEQLRKQLKMPKHIQIEAIIPLGYSSHRERKKDKKRLEWSLFWEEWGKQRRPNLFEEKSEDIGP